MTREHQALMERFRPMAERAAAYWCKQTGTHLEPEDLVTEALLDIVRRAGDYDAGKASWATFADRVVTSRIRHLIRDAGPAVIYLEDVLAGTDADKSPLLRPVEPPQGVSEAVARKLWAAVRKLPKEQRAIIEEHYRDGVSIYAMEQRGHVTRGVLRWHHGAAIRSLRAMLGEWDIQKGGA